MIEIKNPDHIEAMFSRIATSYDRMNALMSFGQDAKWRNQTVATVQSSASEWVLDLGCGTGDLSIAMLPHCRGVVGLDFSREMLIVARHKAEQHNARIGFVQGDAHHMPFEDDAFGHVVAGFALRNVRLLDGVLREMLRVTRPGGRMACLELTPQSNGALGGFTWFFTNRLVPVLGGLVTGNEEAYRYLPRSIEAFPTAERLADMMREVGWRQVGFKRLGLGVVAIHFGEKAIE